jgi:DNA-binding transcriptional LysR family regulator
MGRRVGYRLRVQELDAVCAMVVRGLGLGIVPQRVADRWVRGAARPLRAVRLTDAWARRRLLLVARSFDDLSPAGRRLARHLQATLASMPETGA